MVSTLSRSLGKILRTARNVKRSDSQGWRRWNEHNKRQQSRHFAICGFCEHSVRASDAGDAAGGKRKLMIRGALLILRMASDSQ